MVDCCALSTSKERTAPFLKVKCCLLLKTEIKAFMSINCGLFKGNTKKRLGSLVYFRTSRVHDWFLLIWFVVILLLPLVYWHTKALNLCSGEQWKTNINLGRSDSCKKHYEIIWNASQKSTRNKSITDFKVIFQPAVVKITYNLRSSFKCKRPAGLLLHLPSYFPYSSKYEKSEAFNLGRSQNYTMRKPSVLMSNQVSGSLSSPV